MSKRNERTLYECLHPKVWGEKISCAKGHILGQKSDGSIDTHRLARGDRLGLTPCQQCQDFSSMGPPVPDTQKGWARGRVQIARARIGGLNG